MNATHTTRESWIVFVAEQLRPVFAEHGAELPPYRVTMSLTGSKRAVGVCYSREASTDKTFEILIRLDQAAPIDVAAILAHELVHAAVGLKAGHGPVFAKLAKAIGLEGKMTATVPGPAFRARVAAILDAAGPFPHATLHLGGGTSSGPKKQGTRMLKCSCDVCGYTCRTTRKWIDDVGAPLCPAHPSAPMRVDGDDEEREAA